MSTHLDTLHEAVTRLDAAWADAAHARDLDRAHLVSANAALGALSRLVGALQAEVAAGIAHESRTELGPASLAKQQGFRTPAQLIAASTGTSAGEANRLVSVGEATAPRTDLLGSPLPARYPILQRALSDGALSASAAALAIALLDGVRMKIDPARLQAVEEAICERTVGLSLDDVRRLVARAEAHLDPDGAAPRDDEARAKRGLTFSERRGMFHLEGAFDPESAAPIKAALQGYVSAAFATRKSTIEPDAPDADRRSVVQLQADALSSLCAHALGCENDAPALAGATVIVRVALSDLASGTGFATIDGCDRPVSVGAARRMAASGGVIPAVLDTDSEILDWGREKRLFTRSQRLALVERDGGCAMCLLPPSMTRAHHIRWWERDAGPTDLDNGVLLCETCHHRIHDNGWEVRIDGCGAAGKVWFIPPPYVDPDRTPRLGGLARYTLAA